MKYDSTKIVVLDIEATCDDPRPAWASEVIEVGVCLLDSETLAITDKRSLLIKPVNSPITKFCTDLTTITKELLDEHGTTLEHAISILKKEYAIDRRVWASWGFYDNQMLNADCAAKGIKFPGQARLHVNLKTVVGLERGIGVKCSVSDALKHFSLEFKGTQHRGHDDAENIATIYAKHLNDIRSGMKNNDKQ